TTHVPQISMFTVPGSRAESAQEDCRGTWVVCSPEMVGRFSAAAYFFGREIHRVQGGAVGLITSAVGGTLIESWISPEAQRATPALKDFFAQHGKLVAAFDRTNATAKEISTHENITSVGGLFNGKIAPLIPYALRGVAWYQGESNASPERAPFYETQLRLLVRDWRAKWGGELPFAWVQLPNVKRTESWAHIREAQLKALDLPRTGMAITIDIGESRNLHPPNKQEVGRRLAQWALGDVYGRKVATSGPLIARHETRGSEIVLRFRHTDGGLVAKDGPLTGFIVAGENRAWTPASARIEGDTVIVSAPNVPRPIAVRYAWEADPICNLTNGAGLPASPFRTDDWKP
ncbi:MAG: sialate O-acetylesterase, partial [Chthoniobacteraceae bacterium]